MLVQIIEKSQSNLGNKVQSWRTQTTVFRTQYILSEGTEVLDQWNEIKTPKIDAHIHDQLDFRKGTKELIRKWENFKKWRRNCCCCSFTVMSDSFATPRTVAHGAPLSLVFLRQEYWSGLPFPSRGDLPDPGTRVFCIDRCVLYH